MIAWESSGEAVRLPQRRRREACVETISEEPWRRVTHLNLASRPALLPINSQRSPVVRPDPRQRPISARDRRSGVIACGLPDTTQDPCRKNACSTSMPYAIESFLSPQQRARSATRSHRSESAHILEYASCYCSRGAFQWQCGSDITFTWENPSQCRL